MEIYFENKIDIAYSFIMNNENNYYKEIIQGGLQKNSLLLHSQQENLPQVGYSGVLQRQHDH